MLQKRSCSSASAPQFGQKRGQRQRVRRGRRFRTTVSSTEAGTSRNDRLFGKDRRFRRGRLFNGDGRFRNGRPRQKRVFPKSQALQRETGASGTTASSTEAGTSRNDRLLDRNGCFRNHRLFNGKRDIRHGGSCRCILRIRLDGCRVAKAVSGYGRRGRSCGRGLRTDGSRGHLRERLTAFVAEAVGRSGLRTAQLGQRRTDAAAGAASGRTDFGAADAAELRTVRNLCAALWAFDDTLDPLDLLAPLRDLFQRFVYKRDLRGTFCIRVIFMVFIICLADLCV